MTSLLPLLPEMPRLPATDALAVVPAGAPASALASGGGAGAAAPDFAGLLEALTTPPPALPTALSPASPVAAGLAPLPESNAPGAVLAVEAAAAPPPLPDPPRAETLPASALAAWPTGKNLPEPGPLLPPTLPLDPPADAGPATPLPMERPVAAPVSLPGLVTGLRAAAPDEAPADARTDPLPARAARPAPRPAPLPGADAAERPHPTIHTRVRSHALGAPVAPAPVEAAPAPAEDLTPVQATAPDLGTAPPPSAPILPFVPVLRDDAVTAPLAPAAGAPRAVAPAAGTARAVAPAAIPVAATLPEASATRAPAAARTPAAPRLAAPSGALADVAPSPAQTSLPSTPALRPALDAAAGRVDAAPASAPAPTLAPVPAPVLPAESGAAATSGAGALPDAGNAAPAPAATLPASLAAGLPQTAAMLPTERPADPRAAAAPPVAQIESTIAQVGDIREALRAARPAMTLQHAEFGAVSIRLEPAAPDQWRAVLASRDPGFIPAIQAALETRILTAAADPSASFAGQHGASHNGAGDHRYGASPNAGQGSPQPYLGQSGARDGEAAPDHRRPSTAAALAARGDGEAEDPAGLAPGSGGLFA